MSLSDSTIGSQQNRKTTCTSYQTGLCLKTEILAIEFPTLLGSSVLQDPLQQHCGTAIGPRSGPETSRLALTMNAHLFCTTIIKCNPNISNGRLQESRITCFPLPCTFLALGKSSKCTYVQHKALSCRKASFATCSTD